MKYPLIVAALLISFSPFVVAQSALQFDRTIPNYVDVGNTMNTVFTGTNKVTAEGWCYLTSYTFLPTVVGNYGTGMQFLLRVDGNRVAFWVDNGTGFNVINGNTTVALNTWTHLAGVWDGSSLRVYFNGVLDGTSGPVQGGFPANTSPIRIGANQLSESWDGKLDDVRIWTTARTPLEIFSSMSGCLPPASSGLLALYDFEEGAGITLTDRTGHGYNGTLINSPGWTTGTGCIALPVNYVSINALKSGGELWLNWKVTGENNILRYDIERSLNGRNYEFAGTVPATRSSEYKWRERSISSGGQYYRVKSIALTGEIKYSAIVNIPGDNDRPMVSISPNPVRGKEVNLQFRNQSAGIYTFRLMDASGRLQPLDPVKHQGGTATYTMQLPIGTSAGIYRLIMTDANKRVITQAMYVQQDK